MDPFRYPDARLQVLAEAIEQPAGGLERTHRVLARRSLQQFVRWSDPLAQAIEKFGVLG